MKIPARLTPEVAAARLLEAGYEALEECPGANDRWRARHLPCGEELEVVWARIHAGNMAKCSCLSARYLELGAARAQQRKAKSAGKAVERMRAAGWEPLEPYPGSHERWLCRCLDCGSEGMPYMHGVSKTKGCRVCSGRKIITEESARATMLASAWRPLTPFPGPREPWPCECINCGHKSSLQYETTHSGHSGCRMCSARSNGAKRRARFEPTAVRVMLNMQLRPLEPFPGSHKPWLCLCLRCNSLTSPPYGSVAQGSCGCETCRRASQGAAKKSRYADGAEARIRAGGYTPLEPYPGMNRPWECLCRCGRKTNVWVSVLGEGSRGCRWCADYGFKMQNPGVVYLLSHEQMGALKVGVTAVGSTRLDEFQKRGWRVLAQGGFETGQEAVSVETRTLEWWRQDLGLEHYLGPEQMPLGG